MDAAFSAGAAGYLVWGWHAQGTNGNDQYAVGAADPLLRVIGRYGDNSPTVGEGPTTPPMGFNHYNHFGNDADENLMHEIADAIVSNGMRDAGYVYVNVDDSWQGNRSSDGTITANSRYPQGMAALADYVHRRGLKFGIYTSPAPVSCGGRPGSAGHVIQDVNTFASWGVDYIKLDWCGTDSSTAGGAAVAEAWRDAIDGSGRNMILSINAGGDQSVPPWASRSSTLWRVGDDICASWFNKTRAHNKAANDCFDTAFHSGIFDYLSSSTENGNPYSAPGTWADPDMLEVGNPGIDVDEAKTHFSAWAMWSAPLIAGNDPRSMNADDAAGRILLNREVIDVDQDLLAAPARRALNSANVQLWVKRLQNGRYAVLVINMSDVPRDITFSWQDLGLYGHYEVRDLWQHSDLGRAEVGQTVKSVPRHGSVMLIITPTP